MNKWDNKKILTGAAAVIGVYAILSTYDRVEYLITLVNIMRAASAQFAGAVPPAILWRNIFSFVTGLFGLLAWWALAALAWLAHGDYLRGGKS